MKCKLSEKTQIFLLFLYILSMAGVAAICCYFTLRDRQLLLGVGCTFFVFGFGGLIASTRNLTICGYDPLDTDKKSDDEVTKRVREKVNKVIDE